MLRYINEYIIIIIIYITLRLCNVQDYFHQIVACRALYAGGHRESIVRYTRAVIVRALCMYISSTQNHTVDGCMIFAYYWFPFRLIHLEYTLGGSVHYDSSSYSSYRSNRTLESMTSES